jgi:hypothetical protein
MKVKKQKWKNKCVTAFCKARVAKEKKKTGFSVFRRCEIVKLLVRVLVAVWVLAEDFRGTETL